MKKLFKHNKLILCLAVTVFSVVFTFVRFGGSFAAIFSSVSRLWQSLIAYLRFCFFVEDPSESPFHPSSVEIRPLPSSPGEFNDDANSFLVQLFDGENFAAYGDGIGELLLLVLRFLPFFAVLVYLVRKFVRRQFENENNDYAKESKPLKIFKAVSGTLYHPVKRYLQRFVDYVQPTLFPRLWLVIWLFNFNVFAVLLSTVSIAVFFFISFDFTALYYYVHNAVSMLIPMFNFIPWPVFIVLALWLIDRFRKNIAYKRLNRMELQNVGFINERSIALLTCGTVGKGKTTQITDMVLSTNAYWLVKAREIMQKYDDYFSNFPWMLFIQDLKKEFWLLHIYNLASCEKYISKIVKRFKRTGCIYNYNYKDFGLSYDDKKQEISLFDALQTYAKAFFVFTTLSPLVYSNYSIRSDFVAADLGNIPAWNTDFFQKRTDEARVTSQYVHVIDFDMVRLGKLMNEHNSRARCFDFGIIVITEVGKERGNQISDQNLKTVMKQENIKFTEVCTPLNDNFNDCIKLIRHNCTVDGFPFARVFMDEQRPESLGADARDLCEIIRLGEKTETRLAMPFFFIAELLHDLIYPRYVAAYQDYQFHRGDNTLLMYFLKSISAGFHRYYDGIYNRFGYHVRDISVEDAAISEQISKQHPYFLMTKKIYSNRFSTDAYSGFFADHLVSCGTGIRQAPQYKGIRASKSEFISQNSHHINKILKHTQKPNEGVLGPVKEEGLTWD